MAEGYVDRLETLFHQAVDLPPEERRALLDAACANDPGLRAALERLLADDTRLRSDENAGFLDSPLVRRSSLAVPAGPLLPERVGRYRILRLLGVGGMGAVYEAEQDNPRRTVALKVIRPGLVTPSLFKRFSHEAQILGRLHHRGIAAIYEAGVGEDGQPFFALELVRGVTLDEFARGQALDAAARLELLARVCDAVHYAHEQGVIHRDLKPSNIMVDGSGQTKVLDFSVARAHEYDLRVSTAHTQTGQMVGTLAYMSPEQVSADSARVDRRSDVYTLGVILFELLAGRLPYLLENLPLPQAAEVIRERQPDRIGSIDARYRGDVETILAKTLEKEPGRRYASAAELGEEIRRHLQNEPIRARPPSLSYQLSKFARRHKAIVGGVAGVIVALAVGLIGTLFFALREVEQRGQAEQNARRAIQETQAAIYQTYRARLAAAAAALQNHDVADAARHLSLAPAQLRNWEWRHLNSRIDDSSAVFPTPVFQSFLLPHKTGLRREVLVERKWEFIDEQGHIDRSTPFLPFPEGDLWRVAPTPAGILVMDMVADGVVRLRHDTGKEWLRMKVQPGLVFDAFAVSPNLKWLAISWKAPGGLLTTLYDSAGKEYCRFAELTGRLWSLTFSPDSTMLACASDDGTAWLWDIATRRAIGGALRHPGKIRVRSVSFRSDMARLVTASADGTVCQWDTSTGLAVEAPFERHTGEVWIAEYSPDGRWIASAGTDRTVRLWRATGGQEALVMHGHTDSITQLAFTGDGRRLESVSLDGTARMWEVDAQLGMPVLRGHTNSVYPVAYSPDGQWIASGSWDKTVRLWDAQTGECCAILPHGGFVRTLAFSPDGSWLVSGCDGEENLSIWDMATGQRRKWVEGPGTVLEALAVNPNGTRIAAAERFGRLIIVDVATGKSVASLRIGTSLTRLDLAYSPDGRWLAATGSNNQVLIFDMQTNLLRASLSGHTDEVYSVAFSPDGQRLASASRDRTVRVWDVATASCRIVLKGHTDDVFTAIFQPGGNRLASAGRDRAICLWDLAATEEDKLVARLPGHANYIFTLAFSLDGKSLVSASGDNSVRLWDTEPLHVRHEARRECDTLRPQADKLVARLLVELRDTAQVVARLRADDKLSAPLRRAAMQALMRQGQQPPH